MAKEVIQSIHDIFNSELYFSTNIIETINSEKIMTCFLNSKNNVNLFFESQECPDILLIDEDIIYGIEHFAFDDSISNENGSSNMKTKMKFKKQFKNRAIKYLEENINTNYYTEITTNDFIDLNCFYDFFVMNFLMSFDAHYKKIEKYKENIQQYLEKNHLKKEIKIYFLVQNVCRTLPIESEEQNIYLPFYSKEIQTKIENSILLNGIISSNQCFTFLYSKDDGPITKHCSIIEKELYYSLSNKKRRISRTISLEKPKGDFIEKQ